MTPWVGGSDKGPIGGFAAIVTTSPHSRWAATERLRTQLKSNVVAGFWVGTGMTGGQVQWPHGLRGRTVSLVPSIVIVTGSQGPIRPLSTPRECVAGEVAAARVGPGHSLSWSRWGVSCQKAPLPPGTTQPSPVAGPGQRSLSSFPWGGA